MPVKFLSKDKAGGPASGGISAESPSIVFADASLQAIVRQTGVVGAVAAFKKVNPRRHCQTVAFPASYFETRAAHAPQYEGKGFSL